MHEQLPETPSQLSDEELVAQVARLASSERRTTASLIAHLAELDVRRLHLRAGFSLFLYCTQVLKLSEGGAYNRIVAARAAQQFPLALERLAEGVLNLGTLRLIAPHLTPDNQDALFTLAAGKSKREVQEALAGMFPKADVAASIRKLPTRRTACGDSSVAETPSPSAEAASGGADRASVGIGRDRSDGLLTEPTGQPRKLSLGSADVTGAQAAAADGSGPGEQEGTVATGGDRRFDHPAERQSSQGNQVVMPLSTDRYQFRFTGSGITRDKFRRAQDLLRHAVPNGDAAEIFDRALTALLRELERKKFAASDRPRPPRVSDSGSRTIPAAVKRAVTARDGGGCAFIADDGRRCGATAFLEFHHVVPFARGGPPTEDNIELRCRAHNGFEAELDFGRRELVPGQVERSKDGVVGAAG
jgi:HNH endonuclease